MFRVNKNKTVWCICGFGTHNFVSFSRFWGILDIYSKNFESKYISAKKIKKIYDGGVRPMFRKGDSNPLVSMTNCHCAMPSDNIIHNGCF